MYFEKSTTELVKHTLPSSRTGRTIIRMLCSLAHISVVSTQRTYPSFFPTPHTNMTYILLWCRQHLLWWIYRPKRWIVIVLFMCGYILTPYLVKLQKSSYETPLLWLQAETPHKEKRKKSRDEDRPLQLDKLLQSRGCMVYHSTFFLCAMFYSVKH